MTAAKIFLVAVFFGGYGMAQAALDNKNPMDSHSESSENIYFNELPNKATYEINIPEDSVFQDFVDDTIMAIEGLGMKLTYTANFDNMLHNTRKTFGYSDDIYLGAKVIGFCNAELAHSLTRINPHDILSCPLSLRVYQLRQEPNKIYFSYNKVKTMHPQGEMLVKDMMKTIVLEASGL